MNFSDLDLIAPILQAADEAGYEEPSPIQQKAIPSVLAGRDLLGCAQTGTGKTAAFAMPILQRLYARRPAGSKRPIRALILTPTRELALQIDESFAAYGGHLPLRHCVVFGGVNQNPQVAQLKAGVDILTATPGRLNDLVGQGYIDLSGVEIFVLDEADRMLDMGFVHDVRRVIRQLPAERQTLFFSATMPQEIEALAGSILTDPVKVMVAPPATTVEAIEQSMYFVDKGNKRHLLASLLKDPAVASALVFTRTKHGADRVVRELSREGIRAMAIHGNKSQNARQAALGQFKEGSLRVLVATDIAARGIDIEELSHVFNYNLPDVPETYVHRIGRTGRAGRGGTAVSFCEFGEKPLLKEIEKLLKKSIPVVEDHPWPMEVFEAPKKDARGREINPDDAEARAAARERRRQREENKKTAQAVKPVKGETPVKARREAPARAEKAAQPPASGKRKASGYKPSRTLEEALTAMEPHCSPEEKARPVEYYRDPLAGETIMDATARLLAPRKTARTTEKKPATRQAQPKEGGRRKKGAEPKQEPFPPAKVQNAPRREKKAKAPAEQGGKRRGGRGNGGRRGGPMEVTLRLGSQKDSTEQQGSLMKPYYFNPNED